MGQPDTSALDQQSKPGHLQERQRAAYPSRCLDDVSMLEMPVLADDTLEVALRKTPGMNSKRFLDIAHFCACMANEAMGWPQPTRAMANNWKLSGRAQRLQHGSWGVAAMMRLAADGGNEEALTRITNFGTAMMTLAHMLDWSRFNSPKQKLHMAYEKAYLEVIHEEYGMPPPNHYRHVADSLALTPRQTAEIIRLWTGARRQRAALQEKVAALLARRRGPQRGPYTEAHLRLLGYQWVVQCNECLEKEHRVLMDFYFTVREKVLSAIQNALLCFKCLPYACDLDAVCLAMSQGTMAQSPQVVPETSTQIHPSTHTHAASTTDCAGLGAAKHADAQIVPQHLFTDMLHKGHNEADTSFEEPGALAYWLSLLEQDGLTLEA